jgi:hypothetical protein
MTLFYVLLAIPFILAGLLAYGLCIAASMPMPRPERSWGDECQTIEFDFPEK